jgi:type VI secretion system protein ImpL
VRLLFILAAVAVSLAWALALVLGYSLWWPVGLTLLFASVLGGSFGWRWWRARRGAAGLAAGLKSQADRYAQNLKLDRQVQVQSLQAEFSAGIQRLKGSSLRGGGRAALYALPWYIIIGPSGAGKTTAIQESGLGFPPQQRRKLRGVGGTRNCDWWLANEAVILDTAGRYSTQEEDQREWFEFLDLLRRHRPRKPVNGLLVAISIADLSEGEQAAEALGQTIRARIDEVTGRLQMQVPVYLLLTKCDLVPGFVDTFESLDPTERAQILGFTVPYGGAQRIAEVFEEHFVALLHSLDLASLQRAHATVRTEARERVLQFPRQLDQYRSALSVFLDTLFSQDIYQGTPTFRGMYLTSGTQEGRPIDQLLGRVRKSLGLTTGGDSDTPRVDTKSYFLRDVFHDVLIPDQDLATRSRSEVRRQRLQDFAILGLSVTLGLGAAALVLMTHLERQDLAQRALLAAKTVAGETRAYPLLGLDRLMAALPGLCGMESDGGLRLESPLLYDAACQVVVHELRTHGVEPEALALSDALASQVDAYKDRNPPTGAAQEELCALTRDRILLSAPRPGDITLGKAAEREQFSIRDRLQRRLREGSEEPDIGARVEPDDALIRQLDLFMHLHELVSKGERDGSQLWGPVYGSEVKGARGLLAAQLDPTRFLDQLEKEIAAQRPRDSRDLASIIGLLGNLAYTEDAYAVPAAYTRAGWENGVKQRLFGDTEGCPGWVVAGNNASQIKASRQEDMKRVQKEYFERYVKAWQELTRRVRFSTDAGQLKHLLQALVSSGRPQLRLLKALDAQRRLALPLAPDLATLKGAVSLDGGVALAQPAPKHAEAVMEGMSGPVRFALGVPDTTAPPAMETYLTWLDEALIQLEAVELDPAQGAACRSTVASRLSQLDSNIDASVEPAWRQPLRALLRPPLEAVVGRCSGEYRCGLQDDWRSKVVAELEGALKRYPFSPSAHEEVSPARLGELFGPEGPLWGFVETDLKGQLRREGSHFKRERGSNGPKLPGWLLQFYDAAWAIRRGFGLAQASKPHLHLRIKIYRPGGAARMTVSHEGTKYVQGSGEPRTVEFNWPGTEEGFWVQLETPSGGREEGLRGNTRWGLMRYLGRSQLEWLTSTKVRSTLKISDLEDPVVLDVSFDDEEAARLFKAGMNPLNVIRSTLHSGLVGGCR